MKNKLTTIDILEIVANNWDDFSEEEQKYIATLFANHSVQEIIMGLESLRGEYENKIN